MKVRTNVRRYVKRQNGKRIVVQKHKRTLNKNLGYAQLKRKGSRIRPYTDTDRDGKVNTFDCKPLDPMRQDSRPKPSTEKVLIGMLKENTGIAMMDSGGAYGRNWQRNQGVNFNTIPSVSVDATSVDDIIIEKDVYHFLKEHLDYSEDAHRWNKKFQAYRRKNSDEYDLGLMEDFSKEHNDGSAYQTEGGAWNVVNTYNGESLLSQVLQYTVFGNQGKTYIILQIHGGADVRGGYTDPKIFEVEDIDSFVIDQTYVNASDGENHWLSDDAGYHWYYDGSTRDEKPFKDNIEVREGKVYSKLNGKQITFR